MLMGAYSVHFDILEGRGMGLKTLMGRKTRDPEIPAKQPDSRNKTKYSWGTVLIANKTTEPGHE